MVLVTKIIKNLLHIRGTLPAKPDLISIAKIRTDDI
jgi:hypothetical protein